jgi:hypothetical protein
MCQPLSLRLVVPYSGKDEKKPSQETSLPSCYVAVIGFETNGCPLLLRDFVLAIEKG